MLPLLAILRYIEASKARLYHSGGNSVAPVAQAVLLYTFENILKVLHPFMPFVTEELWQVNVMQDLHYLAHIDTEGCFSMCLQFVTVDFMGLRENM